MSTARRCVPASVRRSSRGSRRGWCRIVGTRLATYDYLTQSELHFATDYEIVSCIMKLTGGSVFQLRIRRPIGQSTARRVRPHFDRFQLTLSLDEIMADLDAGVGSLPDEHRTSRDDRGEVSE